MAQSNTNSTGNSRRGFASMSDDKVQKIAEKGGNARKQQIQNDPSMSYQKLGRMGGEARKRQIQSDPNQSYSKLGEKGGSSSHGGGRSNTYQGNE